MILLIKTQLNKNSRDIISINNKLYPLDHPVFSRIILLSFPFQYQKFLIALNKSFLKFHLI